MRFALVSDVHFGPRASHQGRLRKLSDRGPELLKRFVAKMNEGISPELVVNLGDVVEDESEPLDAERYREFLGILGGLDCQLLHVAGNHDTVHIGPEKLSALWGRPSLHYREAKGDVHFIVLHSVEEKDRSVVLPVEQLSWLESELFAADGPVVVLVHHPLSELCVDNNPWFKNSPHLCRVRNRKAVRSVIEASGKVRAVLNGHAHQNSCDVIRGVPYITLQSLIENVHTDAPGEPAAAHAVVTLSHKRLLFEVHGAQPAQYQVDY